MSPLKNQLLTCLALTVCIALSNVADTVYADKAGDKRTAANGKRKSEDRLAACVRLLAIKDLTTAERAWALLTRGEIYRAQKKWSQALADFDASQKIDAKNPMIHRNRGLVYFSMKKYAQAENEFTRVLELNPRDDWTWFLRGRIRVVLKKYDLAMKDYDQALILDPRYFWAYTGRSRLHRILKNYEKAIADSNGALALDPYYASAYASRGSALEEMGKKAEAIHDYRVALALDPNVIGPENGLKRLVGSKNLDQSRTAAFRLPKKGLELTYLTTVRKVGPPKSEMESSIAALTGWFKKQRVPVPHRKKFIVREVIGNESTGLTTVRPRHAFEDVNGKLKATDIKYYRSMWSTLLPFPAGNLDVKVDREFLDGLFPLKVGTKGQGGAKLEFVAPAKLRPQDKFLGAKKPGDRLPFGNVKWKAQVVGWEQVTVGAGTFDAVVIRFEEQMNIELLGRSNTADSVVTWWYAPSIGWWVKRTRSVEDNVITDEAMTIK